MRGRGWRVVVVLFFFCGIFNSLNAQTISDSLVENLSCEDLSIDSVFSHIRAEAFSEDRQLPIRNWSEADKDGICAGMALFQRLFFYLARFEDREFSSKEVREILNMLRRRINVVPKNSKDPFLYKLLPLQVFGVPKGDFDGEMLFWLVNEWRKSKSLDYLLDLFQTQGNSIPIVLSGLVTVVSKSLSRNERVIKTIVKDLKRKRIHKLTIFDEEKGHSVLPLSIVTESENRIVLSVYDPNFSGTNVTLEWTPNKLHYLGYGTYDENRPLFGMISNTDELSTIERVLFKYYKKRCADAININ